MTFAAEFDDLRPELRRDVADTISIWPKTDADGNVTATSATYSVVAPDGTELVTETAATITAVGTAPDTVSRIDCAIPAQSVIDEGYQVRVKWSVSGGVEQLTVVPFDVVAWPIGATVSLNDILQARPAAQNEIASLANQLGMTPEQYAALLGYRARVVLDERIRDLVVQSAPSDAKFQNRVALHGWRGRVYLRGYAILDRRRLQRLQVMLALRELYQTLMTGSDAAEDPRRALFERYSAEADAAFRSLGRLEFDFSDDLVPDTKADAFDGSLVMQRVQSQ